MYCALTLPFLFSLMTNPASAGFVVFGCPWRLAEGLQAFHL